MTIPLLEVSFNNIFECGQGYVALSRATCLRGLTLTSFTASSVRAHPKVKEFYQRIEQFTHHEARDSSMAGASNTVTQQQPADMVTTTLLDLAASYVPELPSSAAGVDACAVVELDDVEEAQLSDEQPAVGAPLTKGGASSSKFVPPTRATQPPAAEFGSRSALSLQEGDVYSSASS